MAEISDEILKTVENDIRDLINWIRIYNEEEVEGGFKRVEDDAAQKLTAKLHEIAKKLGFSAV